MPQQVNVKRFTEKANWSARVVAEKVLEGESLEKFKEYLKDITDKYYIRVRRKKVLPDRKLVSLAFFYLIMKYIKFPAIYKMQDAINTCREHRMFTLKDLPSRQRALEFVKELTELVCHGNHHVEQKEGVMQNNTRVRGKFCSVCKAPLSIKKLP